MIDLWELEQECHEYARRQGFWDVPAKDQVIPAKLMLIVSEVAEAMEADRNDDLANMSEELADIIIRVCDLAGFLQIDLELAVNNKMEKNRQRPFKHGKAY